MQTNSPITLQKSLQTRTLDSFKVMHIARNGGNRIQICSETRKKLTIPMLRSLQAGLRSFCVRIVGHKRAVGLQLRNFGPCKGRL
jgi:hypothetical protein